MENFNVALGHTLIHSLWQGVILAGVTGLIIMFTRRSTAAKRYLLMVAALMIFAVVTLSTFYLEYNNKPSGVITQIMPLLQATTVNVHTTMQPISLSQQVTQYINMHTQNIVLIWFLIVLARSLQLATGLQGLSHLRRKNLYAVDEVWAKRVGDLAISLGITSMVGMAESGMAKVPMVIGHLKPLILIPVGLLTALPAAEIEAILIHELAHIRRRDYLVNLLQSFLEIVLFFNPAVLWLSALIRTERENCCDDIAVAQTSSKINYIRALVSCQEYQLATPAFAMAFPGKRNQLLNRVKRMASGSNHALNIRERSILFITLLTASLLTAAFTNVSQIDRIVLKTGKAVSHALISVKKDVLSARDTVPVQPITKIAKTVTQKTTKVDSKISALSSSVSDTIRKLQPLDAVTIKLDKQKALATADSISRTQMAPTQPVSARMQPITPIQPISTPIPPITPLNGKATPYKAEYKPYQAKSPDIGAQVTVELLRDKLITPEDKNVSFKLSGNEMIINGVRQPESVFNKYKERFVPPISGKGTWTLYSNYHTDSDKKVKPQ